MRRRGNAFDAVIQALKHANIPVAGADRLKLTEHIGIIDLMNLADALLLPQDDLALAVTLKSPLFGLSDDDLFTLAWQRKGSLHESLRRHATTDARFSAVAARLDAYARHSVSDTPFAFYAWLLGGDGGRARILRRLGHEANDALDEFLELALAYERRAPASLQGFMAWLRAADTEVKRDMEISRDEVRVMTVHGAKGLEAAVVFLIDTTSSPSDTQRLRLIQLPQSGGGEVVVWAGRKAEDAAAVAAGRTAMLADTEDEYRRLLYVAMTRAADRLIIGGCMPGNMNNVRKLCWYDLVARGLVGSGLEEQTIETPEGRVKRYARALGDAAPLEAAAASSGASPAIALPSWLRVAVATESASEHRLRPSDGVGAPARGVGRGDQSEQRARAIQRGTLVHRLLQSLPDVAAPRRREATLNFLARNAGHWSEADREALTGKVLAVIAEARFAPVFAAGSRPEVSIVGRLPRPGQPPALVSGQIDRLVVTDAEVLIVDFKTNLAPPETAAEAPAAYVRQLALYRAVLRQLYPARIVRAALLWTEAPDLMEISDSALDAALASQHGTVSALDPAPPGS